MKQYLFLLAVLLLVGCSEYEMGATKYETPINSVAANEVQSLIEKARWGDGNASKRLADCYREGRGVKRDFIGMMAMVGMSEKQGAIGSIDAYFQSVPEDDNYRRMYDIMEHFSQRHYEKADSIIALLKQQNNPDVEVLMGIDAIKKGDTIAGKQIIQRAIDKGSSFGALILCFFGYESNQEQDMTDMLKLADEHPFVYKIIGDMYLKRTNNEAENERIAAEYYLKADKYAMLSRGAASWLLAYHEDGGEISLSEVDVKRLQALADINQTAVAAVDTVVIDK